MPTLRRRYAGNEEVGHGHVILPRIPISACWNAWLVVSVREHTEFNAVFGSFRAEEFA